MKTKSDYKPLTSNKCIFRLAMMSDYSHLPYRGRGSSSDGISKTTLLRFNMLGMFTF